MDITTERKLLQMAYDRYHVDVVNKINMGQSGNMIFEVQKEQIFYILKVSEYHPVEQAHLEMQLDWVMYLSQHMNGVFKPVYSVHHHLMEIVSIADRKYMMFLQEKALGNLVDIHNPKEYNETLFFHLGALMGKMHACTAQYVKDPIDSRFVWDNDAYSWRGKVPIKDAEVRRFDTFLKTELHKLPITKDSYGIIHYDIHPHNFFVHHGAITIFDFDACQFNWYAADIASTLFFMVQTSANPLMRQSEEVRSAFAQRFLIAYLKGYTQSHTLHEYWLYTFDLFMKYQMIDEYRSAQDYLKEELGDQHAYYLDWFKKRIIQQIPYVDIDYQMVLEQVPGIIKA